MDKTQAQVQKDLEQGIGRALNADDSVAFRVRNVEFAESSSNTHDVIITSNDLELKTNGQQDNKFSFSTYNTLGTLVDAINNETGWEAEIVDGQRSDGTNSDQLVTRSSNTIRPREKVEVNFDVSNLGKWTCSLEVTAGDFVPEDRKQQHRAGLERIIAKNDVTSGTPVLEIYEIDQARSNKEKIAEVDMADNTEEDVDLPTLSSDFGKDILVEMTGSIQDTGYLRVMGKRQ